MSNYLRTAAARGVVAAVMLAAAAPALASDETIDVSGRSSVATKSETVSSVGLDLRTAAGQRRFAARVRDAADRVCTRRDDLWDRFADVEARHCATRAASAAVHQARALASAG